MNTFNLAIIFGDADAVFTIVCASENPIDKAQINRVATKHFHHFALLGGGNFDQIISRIANGIKRECNCDAVIVRADCACMIT